MDINVVVLGLNGTINNFSVIAQPSFIIFRGRASLKFKVSKCGTG